MVQKSHREDPVSETGDHEMRMLIDAKEYPGSNDQVTLTSIEGPQRAYALRSVDAPGRGLDQPKCEFGAHVVGEDDALSGAYPSASRIQQQQGLNCFIIHMWSKFSESFKIEFPGCAYCEGRKRGRDRSSSSRSRRRHTESRFRPSGVTSFTRQFGPTSHQGK